MATQNNLPVNSNTASTRSVYKNWNRYFQLRLMPDRTQKMYQSRLIDDYYATNH